MLKKKKNQLYKGEIKRQINWDKISQEHGRMTTVPRDWMKRLVSQFILNPDVNIWHVWNKLKSSVH